MGDKKKLLFVFNPFSGKAQIKNQLLDIVDTMVKADYQVTIYPTQASGDAIHKVEEEAGEYDLVVCSGGDGTLDEAVTGMMHREKKVPLGYIPAGSTNDFATSLKIPKEMAKAAETAVKGKPFACDIGAFNEDYFVYVAAFGLFTSVSYKTSQEWKNVLGHAAYILEGMRSLHDIPSYMMQVEYDNIRLQDEFIYGMISNSTSVGGFKGMTGKDVLLDDGVFEVTLIKTPRNPIELNEIIACLINLVDDTDMIYSFKTDKVVFTSKKEVPWTLDGEFGGNQVSVTVQNLCKAVEIMVPEEE
ncbi:MAG: YegS/Rv2252/BmrU family lipid kinase [Clostridiales bacterium]|nr:YegS/Rv2252/BmrU family lipid kinase [Clostridiales bacterium]